MPALLLGVLAPPVLLALLLWMERVERGLPDGALIDQLTVFLDQARPEEVEALVTEGLGPALDRYWRRRRVARLLPGLTP